MRLHRHQTIFVSVLWRPCRVARAYGRGCTLWSGRILSGEVGTAPSRDGIGSPAKMALSKAHTERIATSLPSGSLKSTSDAAWTEGRMAARGITVSHNTIWEFSAARARFKKRCLPLSRLVAMSPQKTAMEGPVQHLDPDRLVFIDETWQDQIDADQGWGQKARVCGVCAAGHWRTLTFLVPEKERRQHLVL